MLKTDQVLWEQELTEHMTRYGTDLLDLPPVTFPPPQLPQPPRPPQSRARTWLRRLMIWTSVALVSSTVGFSLGWYVI